MDLRTLDTIDAGTLTEGMREGLDCVDCGAVAPLVMEPVGRAYAPRDSQGWQLFSCCRRKALKPAERAERQAAFGRLGAHIRTFTEYSSPTLMVTVMEHAQGAVYVLTTYAAPLSAADMAFLESLSDLRAAEPVNFDESGCWF